MTRSSKTKARTLGARTALFLLPLPPVPKEWLVMRGPTKLPSKIVYLPHPTGPGVFI